MRLLFRCPQKKRSEWEQLQCNLIKYAQSMYKEIRVIKKDGYLYIWEDDGTRARSKTWEFWL